MSWAVILLGFALSAKPQKMEVTMYTPKCSGCTGVMANGQKADPKKKIVAASKHWKLGSCVMIETSPGKWVKYTVADRGPQRPNHLDILVKTEREAIAFGRKALNVKSCKK